MDDARTNFQLWSAVACYRFSKRRRGQRSEDEGWLNAGDQPRNTRKHRRERFRQKNRGQKHEDDERNMVERKMNSSPLRLNTSRHGASQRLAPCVSPSLDRGTRLRVAADGLCSCPCDFDEITLPTVAIWGKMWRWKSVRGGRDCARSSGEPSEFEGREKKMNGKLPVISSFGVVSGIWCKDSCPSARILRLAKQFNLLDV